jgi:hemerythrin-like domain-containing protein
MDRLLSTAPRIGTLVPIPQDTPIDVHDPDAGLAREHRLIERGLNVLSRICDESRRTNGLDTADVTLVIQFLRDFADRTHHLKEKKILFPAIESRTFFPGCGLISEHQLSRERVNGMADAVEGPCEATLRAFVSSDGRRGR